MPSLEEYASDPDDMDLDLAVAPPPSATAKGKMPAMPPADLFPGGAGGMGGMGPEPSVPKAVRILYDGSFGKVTDEAWTRWDTIYPIYVDAKRPQQDGARRVNAKVALEWPFAELMAKACRMLGFEVVFEPSKTHPKDWENPGRIKVQLKTAEGKPVNASIKNKRVLLARMCTLLAPHQPKAPAPTASNPHPVPPIHRRLPANSPAISHGTLDEAIKGGGPLGAMFGGGASEEDEAAIEKAKKDKEDEDKRKKEQMLKQLKPKKMHIKRRR
ncbi:uncharacterized protein RHOBADRAFT_51519 [Rhodotorula graminis WP1]|uniref:Signal recognition particle, SRP19 subunit n=1 Tax=Rhodotorula graminis (strain WP1) TaxID=578459 RepID=A0A194SE14_RHOGW|nr:uncharacterized protein RHOBADRAFT_51519 [Rhodotorula graminis WP1]KPV77701.1 hypothetical protein RHOBADRAFT_51519 [Rhodotorula graminis WP1]